MNNSSFKSSSEINVDNQTDDKDISSNLLHKIALIEATLSQTVASKGSNNVCKV